MATISIHAQYADGTPVTALYVTLESLQEPVSFYEGFTDYEGDITVWYEAADQSPNLRTTVAFADIHSNWRMSFHVAEHLTHFPGAGLPFNHICTHFSVRMAPRHHITLRLARDEYIITHGGDPLHLGNSVDREVSQPSLPLTLRHPQPLPPMNPVLTINPDLARNSPQTPDAFTPTRVYSADFISLFEKSETEEIDEKVIQVDQEVLGTGSVSGSQSLEPVARSPDLKRKSNFTDDGEAVGPRRSRRLMGRN